MIYYVFTKYLKITLKKNYNFIQAYIKRCNAGTNCGCKVKMPYVLENVSKLMELKTYCASHRYHHIFD